MALLVTNPSATSLNPVYWSKPAYVLLNGATTHCLAGAPVQGQLKMCPRSMPASLAG